MKKKLAFVDHNFHKKSRSGDFLRDIFKKNYKINNFWWSLKDQYNLYKKIKNYENIFFFQSLLPLEDMIKLRDKNLMWAPMYDNLDLTNNFWKKIKFLNLKILAFSNPVKNLCKKHGCNFLRSKFGLKFKKNKNNNSRKLQIFFWYRNNISFYDWIKKFNSEDIKQIIYFNCPDPGRSSEFVKERDIKKYKVKIISKPFMSKKKYINFIKNCDVFVCPRKQEGIGMSFLEAISYGKYLISYKDTTMDEYITNEKIGIFFDDKLKKINTRKIKNSQKFRKIYAEKIYKEWNLDKIKVISFFNRKIFKKYNNKLNYIYFVKDYLIKLKNSLKKITI